MSFQLDKNIRYGYMPGCSLPSYNPDASTKTIEYLNEVLPKFSVVQKCCGKPTKLIGQYDLFKERFAGLCKDIHDVEIEEMIVACQSCKLTFNDSSDIAAHSLWSVFPAIGLPEHLRGKAKDSNVIFTIHDACSTRYDSELQDGIRWILTELGYQIKESEYSREKTRCCGAGGMVVPANPEAAKKVMQRRVETLESDYSVVYCSACRSSILQGGGKSWHILDLVWGPVVMDGDNPPNDILASPVKAWSNRYKSKAGIKKVMKHKQI